MADTTSNRGYNLLSINSVKLPLQTAFSLLEDNFTKIDDDMATVINRLEVSPTFDVGVTSGKVVYLDIDGTYKLAIADNSGKDIKLGISDTTNEYVFFNGKVTISQTFTIGAELYLSDITAGDITTDKTGVFLGYYLGSNVMLFYPISNIKPPILFGNLSGIYFEPNDVVTLVNYPYKNLSYLDNANGKITIGSAGNYLITVQGSLTTSVVIESFRYDLYLAITGLSDVLLDTGIVSNYTKFSIKAGLVSNFTKGKDLTLKLKMYNFEGNMTITPNNIYFKVEKV